MNRFIACFCLLVICGQAHSAEELPLAFPDELQEQDGVTFYQGHPFTGLLLSKGTMTQIGQYQNGLREGLFKLSNTQGNITSETTYAAGQIQGTQVFYNADGKVRSFAVHRLGDAGEKEVATFDGEHKLLKKEVFKDGVKTAETTLENGEEVQVLFEFYPAGHQLKTRRSEKAGRLDGSWAEWNIEGQKTMEGAYSAGAKQGIWRQWYDNGVLRRETEYKDDKVEKVIFDNPVQPKDSVAELLVPGSRLYRYLNEATDEPTYLMVVFNAGNEHGDSEFLQNQIAQSLDNRAEYIPPDLLAEHKQYALKYRVEFFDPVCDAQYDDGHSTLGKGFFQVQVTTAPGYRGKIGTRMRVTDMSTGRMLLDKPLEATTSKYPDPGTARAQIGYAVNQLRGALIGLYFRAFPYVTAVGEIVELDKQGQARTVRISTKSAKNLGRGFEFNVFATGNSDTPIGRIRIDKLEGQTALCRVNNGEVTITSLINEGQKLVAVSAYSLE